MQELFIKQEDAIKHIVVVQDGNIVEYYEQSLEHNVLEDNIYVGIVKKVVSGMQAAFVDIGEKNVVFIQSLDIQKQVDICKNKEYKQEKIENLCKVGDRIIVQIKRDETEKKFAKSTTHIKLCGEYVILLPNTDILTVSTKIEETEKGRLKALAQKYLKNKYGAIIRTKAVTATENEIKEEINKLMIEWEKILKNAVNKSNGLIYKNKSIVEKLIRDIGTLEKIYINNKEILEEIPQNLISNVEFIEKGNIFNKYNMLKELEKIHSRKIWLSCGGYIVIDKTEALIAIDVNSGKYVGKDNMEETAYKVNKEATEEIAKQLRLRDLSGIIIIDYIDMKNSENKKKILEELKKQIKKDRSKIQIMGFTSLNLLEITRKHILSK